MRNVRYTAVGQPTIDDGFITRLSYRFNYWFNIHIFVHTPPILVELLIGISTNPSILFHYLRLLIYTSYLPSNRTNKNNNKRTREYLHAQNIFILNLIQNVVLPEDPRTLSCYLAKYQYQHPSIYISKSDISIQSI